MDNAAPAMEGLPAGLPADSPLAPAARLIARLSADDPIRRVGVLQLGASWLRNSSDWSAQLAFCGLTPFDYAAHLRAQLRPGARYSGVSRESLLAHLGDLTRATIKGNEVAREIAPSGLGRALLLLNFDLALCLLPSAGRAEFWHALATEAFPRGKTALLLALPSAASVGPDVATAEQWSENGRLERME